MIETKWFLCQLINQEDIDSAIEWVKEHLNKEDYRLYSTLQNDKVVFSRNFAIKNQNDVLAFCLKFHCV